MSTDSKRSHVRIAAAILAAVLVAAVAFTYLSYSAAFTSVDKVTVTSERAGLVMETGAKVKYRGIQIGKVETIQYAGNEAKLTLAIDSSQMRYVPSNAQVKIGGTTVFGAKSVEFLEPADPTGDSLRPGAAVSAENVQLEVNTLFQTLSDVLKKVDPINLNATITALGEGLRGNGDDPITTCSSSIPSCRPCSRTSRRRPSSRASTVTPLPTWPRCSRTPRRSARPSSTSRRT
ncbi:MAG: MCE-family protein [Mycobacterium sp.]|nr:MCE-family protein [Mycobacterium sp.]